MKVPYKLAILLNKLQEANCGPFRKANGELRCRCPAHEDNGPSLYIRVPDDKILLHCKAGCSTLEICDRLDVAIPDLCYDEEDEMVELDDELQTDDGISGSETVDLTATNDHPQTPNGAPETDLELRSAVYAELLTGLELSTTHFRNLMQRGLPATEISARGYKTADNTLVYQAVDRLLAKHGADRLLTIPGFLERSGRLHFSIGKVYQAVCGFVAQLHGEEAGVLPAAAIEPLK
jgi:hypothetical protein